MDGWTPKKLVLASLGVAVFSSALTGGLVVWLVSGQKPPEPAIFSPATASSAPSSPVAPVIAPPPGPVATPPADLVLAGNWYYDRQRWNEAIASYEKALAIGADTPDIRTDLGNCYRFTNRPEAALAEYERAQKEDAGHEHSLYNQASLYAEVLKNPAKANEIAREFMERFPNSSSSELIKKYLVTP